MSALIQIVSKVLWDTLTTGITMTSPGRWDEIPFEDFERRFERQLVILQTAIFDWQPLLQGD